MELCVSTFLCNKKRILDVLPIFAGEKIKNLELWAAFHYGSEHHFPYWEKSYAKQLSAELEKNGIKARAMHAPFSETLDISSLDESLRKETISEIKTAVSTFIQLPGAETVVVHPGGILTRPEEEKKRLAQSRKSLVELDSFLTENKLRLAAENMLPGLIGWQPSVLSFLIEDLPNTGICLDTGHAHISGVLEKMLDLKKRIIAFHLSDTYDSTDRHLIPFEGNADWAEFKNKVLDKSQPELLNFETRHRGDLPKALQEIKAAFQKLKT